MINLLICGVNEDFFSSKDVKSVLNSNKVDNCYMLVHKKKELDNYNGLGKCYLREEVAKGHLKYEADQSLSVIDDKILKYMEPFFVEILTQQRRFEEYHEFQISQSLNDHYEIMIGNLKFWFETLQKNEITHVFFTSVPHEGYDSIIYHLSKYLNLKVGLVYNATIPRRYYYLEDYLEEDKLLEKRFVELKNEYKEVPIDRIVFEDQIEQIYSKWASLEPEKMRPYYAKGNPLNKRYHTRFGVTNIFEAWYMILGEHYKKYNYKMSLRFLINEIGNIYQYIEAIPNTIRRYRLGEPVRRRTKKLNTFYQKLAVNPDLKQKYVYFPLHYQPEASSNPLGGRELTDQRLAIGILAASLPEGYYVYVKSHPEQLAPFRSQDYYSEIAKIKNVKLVSMDTDTYDLMKNAIAVSSLTGTACWEAQFYGIPAILFGYSQKNIAPLSYHVRTVDECKSAIAKIINSPFKDVKKEMKLLTKAIYDTSFGVDEQDEGLQNGVKILIGIK